MADPLQDLIGVESELARVAATLRGFAQSLGAPVVGGYHVTCSDEAEWECAEAFQQSFAQGMLPALKSSRRAVFRTINLGARYEKGAIGIAEEHFAAAPSRETFKLMVVKINRPGPDTELVVGRYGVDWTGETPAIKYEGLGDDPAAYRVGDKAGRLSVEDEGWPAG